MRTRLRPEPILLGAILLLAAILRFGWLDHTSLWSDEGNTWALVQRSFGQIARDAAADIHPPGYYWVLKIWSAIFGTSAAALRSFSALAGVLLVFVTFRIGRYFDDARPVRWSALLAAFLAALNPFQIYYSQEARMYMLLALEAAALFWALFALLHQTRSGERGRRWISGPAIAFVAAGSAGLWTHYSFPIVLLAAGLAFLFDWLRRSRANRHLDWREFGYFALLSALIIVSYLPWLPTAIERVLNWPQGGDAVPIQAGVRLTLQTLLFGPLGELPAPLWPWLAATAFLPLLGVIAWRRQRFMPGLLLWLLAPVGLMFALGLFTEAFLKFLLIASSPWCLLSAAAGNLVRPRWPLRTLLAAFAVAAALLTLPNYYQSAIARDNYAGVARYIAAVGDPARDLVLLNAPGQQEVWSYYDPGLPVLALPATRPPDRAATETALADATVTVRRVHALFWATDEADPEQIVEGWLDRHAFKGMESWQGNLRFVTYRLPDEALSCMPLEPPVHFGDVMALEGWCQAEGAAVTAGDTALVALQWRALRTMDERFKVSVQLQDGARQVIAQHDSEPAGGSRPTSDWQPDEAVTDNHGLFVPPGTPPGPYRLFVTVYEPENGIRLPVTGGDALELGEERVVLPVESPPLEILDMEERVNQRLGPVTLVGYDQHKLGYAHAPATPLVPGDPVEFVFYWQAPDPLPADWPPAQTFTLTLGDQQLVSPLAGSTLPTLEWQADQLVRTIVQLPYDGGAANALLQVGDATLKLERLPAEDAPE